MKRLLPILLTGVCMVWLSGCSYNKSFSKKPNQSQAQYESDMRYCKGEALGTWNDRNGASSIGLRSQKAMPMTYEDCMRQMGYEQAP